MGKKNIFITILMILIIIPTTIFAFDTGVGQDIEATPPEGMEDMGNEILGIILWVGYGIAVGMLIYIGIKYMMSAANEKATLKQSVINYLIGAIIVFGVTTVFNICINLFGEDSEGGSSGDSLKQAQAERCANGQHVAPGDDYTYTDINGKRYMEYQCTGCNQVIKVEDEYGIDADYATEQEKAENAVDIWENGNISDGMASQTELDQSKQKLQEYNNNFMINKTRCNENKNGNHNFVVESVTGESFIYKCVACDEGLILKK